MSGLREATSSPAGARPLVGVALAPSLAWFTVPSGVLGMATMVPQLIVPYAATIAAPHERGRVVGTVMSGLLIGILISRTVSGFVGERFGWRAMYAAAAGLMMILAAALALVLPPQRPERAVPLRELYASLLTITRREPVLRLYSVNQTRIFSLAPEDRSRINTVYMATYFSGGALGSWLGSMGWAHAGWSGVAVVGGALSALALVIFAVGSRPAGAR